jgi:hypothetical protein
MIARMNIDTGRLIYHEERVILIEHSADYIYSKSFRWKNWSLSLGLLDRVWKYYILAIFDTTVIF